VQENHHPSTLRVPESRVNISPSSPAIGVPLTTLSYTKMPPPHPSSVNSTPRDSLFEWSAPPRPSCYPQYEGLAAARRRPIHRLTVDETWPHRLPFAPRRHVVSMVSSRPQIIACRHPLGVLVVGHRQAIGRSTTVCGWCATTAPGHTHDSLALRPRGLLWSMGWANSAGRGPHWSLALCDKLKFIFNCFKYPNCFQTLKIN
jgi:hypothetical protein